jgi:CheY-like chemotaxis protein
MQKVKVLIVEDEDLCQRLFVRFLRRAGYDVVAASDGGQALSLFDDEEPDVLLTDVDMPVMNGLELLDRLRTRRARLPAVVVSGRGDPREGKDVSYHFLAKPIDLVELQEKIQLALAS